MKENSSLKGEEEVLRDMQVSLGTKRPNNWWTISRDEGYREERVPRLVYVIQSGRDIVYVDARTGDVVGRDMLKAI